MFAARIALESVMKLFFNGTTSQNMAVLSTLAPVDCGIY